MIISPHAPFQPKEDGPESPGRGLRVFGASAFVIIVGIPISLFEASNTKGGVPLDSSPLKLLFPCAIRFRAIELRRSMRAMAARVAVVLRLSGKRGLFGRQTPHRARLRHAFPAFRRHRSHLPSIARKYHQFISVFPQFALFAPSFTKRGVPVLSNQNHGLRGGAPARYRQAPP